MLIVLDPFSLKHIIAYEC